MIWATLAQRSDVDVRRVFTDQRESDHKNTDLFGLSLSWELDGPVFLELLERQGIPIWSNQRTDDDPIVFGGGPVLTANPEPLAPFLDVVLLGDGENLLPNFIQKIQETRYLSRIEQLKSLAQVEGIYVPQFYIPQYTAEGALKAITPSDQDIPSFISKQTWSGNVLTHSTVITPDAAWANIHMVETVRSCPELCRFCLASYLTLPFRTSALEEGLIPAIEKGLTSTKRIGLLGASVTQHPQFSELLQWINKDRFDDIRLSVSSVRASTVNAQMTQTLAKHGSKSITIAIESGSEKIRKLVNKKLSEEEIFMAARYALDGGLTKLKLYAMVGLPLEDVDDIEATADLLLRIKRKTSGLRLTLGVSTFVPKAHTPFQWCGVRREADKRLKLLNKRLRPHGITVRAESYKWSLIQALISRSDRRLAPVLYLMKGAHNSFGGWKNAYNLIQNNSELNNPIATLPSLPSWEEIIHENWPFSRVLPWQHLKGALTPKVLVDHHQKSLNQVF
ncbi:MULTISPECIES: B12-binding domain-containing radical SAM protein [Prochlorococcus]|uniref:B12-binding domain-containing radical SAM protein n=1 Tax=Prochlorococcus TaxID=1218 RepID=UPI000533A01E|nr:MULTISPECIES: radical SAM protein [Prochlorococcus]KGG13738.1 hypothetical protein EV05_0396 [Prochlorococcus sp. MIT 0601]